MTQNIGPENRFPQGSKLRPSDQGGLRSGLRVIPEKRLVVLEFGAMVGWLAFAPEHVKPMVHGLREVIMKQWGILPYTTHDLSIRIETDPNKGVVISHLPQPCEMLASNPEMFLAWADRLEAAVKTLRQ